ncbi:alpha/beta fold hydrolase [Lacticaseibacillus chiayiensis]|uniref:alpha/beta fold hydrolase n=1 Tax=Lacticaseibacillus chiayiensis TaxID=2100821 RepID=UPI00101109EC|nr:alpha/beta hydrolase [Lacticaseibacillus chiayiensis]RXT59128.1 alpha/beta hydrolase [Lacticaseibacillus chiayiensis]
MPKKWTVSDFPVGLYQVNHDQSVNFQMNRFFNWSNDREMLQQMKRLDDPKQTYPELVTAFESSGKSALKKNEKLRAAMYFRLAEFYLPSTDSGKINLRHQFISLSNAYYGITEKQHFLIPYENGHMSAYRITPSNPRGTLLFLNGFDGDIEEVTRLMLVLRDAGYDVIYFDGSGQGYCLEEEYLPMTHQWEKPVKAVLDYFHVDKATAIGMSLGGNLALRAAALEPRINRVICYDIFPDFFDCLMNQLPAELKKKFNRSLVTEENKDQINGVADQLMKKSLMLQWAFQQGMKVMGVETPFDFIRKTLNYTADGISPLVKQDVLLLAGANDHYVANDQLPRQIRTLTHVYSLTARRFTAQEFASNHCQLGNVGLALTTMLNWLAQLNQEELVLGKVN